MRCPAPEKVFETGWFATRNFHGEWYEDSDLLEELLHFREDITAEQYFARMSAQMPWWMRLTPLVPAWAIKAGMKKVAEDKELGTLGWLKRTDREDRIRAFFGSREEQSKIPGWEELDLSEPSRTPVRLDHGYDENKPETELDIMDMSSAAQFRGGRCVSQTMKPGDLDTPLEWKCSYGHHFHMRPRTVLLGGHWCPECLPDPWKYAEEAKTNKFLAQVISPQKQTNPSLHKIYRSHIASIWLL